MQIEIKKIKELIPAPYNPRKDLKPGDKEYEKLKRSIDEFGYVEPIIWNKQTGNVVGGHQRLKILKAQGIDEIECVIVDLTPAKEKALNIALNKISGDWDLEKLEDIFKDLQTLDFDLSLTGFDDIEINKLFKEETEDDNFDVEEELNQPVFSQLGDLWICGKHRIFCGDSTKPETYQLLMDGQKANLLLTDPPYLVNYKNKSGSIKNDSLNDEEGYKFLLNAFSCFLENLADDAACYVFYASSKSRVFYDAFEDAGFYVSSGLVWRKNSLVLSRTDYQQNFEPIIYGWKKKGKHNWYGDRKQTTCFDFDKIMVSKKEGEGHPTSKPVPLMAHLIKQSTLENCIVLDGFHGSGSTMIACEQLNRRCFAVELDEKFVDVQVKRYCKLKDNDYNDVYVIRNGEKLNFNDVFLC